MAHVRALALAFALVLATSSFGTAFGCQPKASVTSTTPDGSVLPPPGTCSNPTLVHATVIPAPYRPVLTNATIELRDGRIRQITSEPPARRPACMIDAGGRVVLAGFWNTHVHFTDPRFSDMTNAESLMSEMLLRYGFTSVVDTGADPRVVGALRDAIRAGTMRGPRMLLAGGSFVAENGTPSYLPTGLLPELLSPEAAEPMVDAALKRGADGIKIFSGSFQTPQHTIYLAPEIIAAVTRAAHERDAFVVSHPTDLQGLVNAVDQGVDVLAHTAPPAGRLAPELLQRMKAKNVALTPTLKLWRYELERHGTPPEVTRSFINNGVGQLRDYHAIGGEVLFGTDVGYMTDYDTTGEFELMQRAGLGFHDVLATLTTNPARRFADIQGTLTPGEPADLVMLQQDPMEDLRALARIALVIRAGEIVYTQVASPGPES